MLPASDPYMDPPTSFRIIIPRVPPSSNKIYVTDWKRKMRFKSSEAKKFETEFQEHVGPSYLPWLSKLVGPEQDPHVLYQIHLDFYFPMKELIVQAWAKGKAKNRYKKMDASNRAKLVVDCVAKVTGIDDLHFFGEGTRKLAAETFGVEPQTHVFLFKADPATFGV